jgi:hypothetical protein
MIDNSQQTQFNPQQISPQSAHPWMGSGDLPWWEKVVLFIVKLTRLFLKEMWGIVKSGINSLVRGNK